MKNIFEKIAAFFKSASPASKVVGAAISLVLGLGVLAAVLLTPNFFKENNVVPAEGTGETSRSDNLSYGSSDSASQSDPSAQQYDVVTDTMVYETVKLTNVSVADVNNKEDPENNNNKQENIDSDGKQEEIVVKPPTTAPKPTEPPTTKPTNPPSGGFEKYKVKVTANGSLNIREKPDANSEKVGSLKTGAIVEVIGKSGSWLQIAQGYISEAYTQRVDDGSTNPTNPPTDPTDPPVSGDNQFHYYSKSKLTGWQSLGDALFFFDNNHNYKQNTMLDIGGMKYRFNSYGAETGLLGIDISSHNGTVNWSVAKKYGVDFAIIRAGYRGWGTGKLLSDANFDANVKGALNAGIPVGVYVFSQAITVQEAREEATLAIQMANKYNVTYPIYFDTEVSGAPSDKVGRADGLTKRQRTDITKAFCETVKSAGYKAGIYASASWFWDKLYFNELKNYEIWVAYYTSADNPTYFGKSVNEKMWQYSATGQIPGLATAKNVDLNIGYYDYNKNSDMSSWGSDVIVCSNDNEREACVNAENAVRKAEQTLKKSDYDNAASKVSKLTVMRVKTAMEKRLNAIEGKVK